MISPACWLSVLQKSMGEQLGLNRGDVLDKCHAAANSAHKREMADVLHSYRLRRQLADARRKLEEAAAERADLRTDLAAVRGSC